MMDYILELNEVSKKYAISDFSLDRVSFAVPLGTIMGFVGENGTGKSILAKTILGFYNYDGNIYINNHNIRRLNKKEETI